MQQGTVFAKVKKWRCRFSDMENKLTMHKVRKICIFRCFRLQDLLPFQAVLHIEKIGASRLERTLYHIEFHTWHTQLLLTRACGLILCGHMFIQCCSMSYVAMLLCFMQ